MSAAIVSPRVSETVVRDISLSQITADPGQTRKVFERNALRERAASTKSKPHALKVGRNLISGKRIWLQQRAELSTTSLQID